MDAPLSKSPGGKSTLISVPTGTLSVGVGTMVMVAVGWEVEVGAVEGTACGAQAESNITVINNKANSLEFLKMHSP